MKKPAISLLPETVVVLIAPVLMLAGALNNHQSLQRYKIAFIFGSYSQSSAGWTATSPPCKCAAPTHSSSS
jgi:hypothetical protein